MTGLIGGTLLCSVLLARRLIAMLLSTKPYWGGASEGYIDKAKQPGTHAFFVCFVAFVLAVSVAFAALFLWSVINQP